MSDVYKKLTEIQQKINAPKNLYNNYGGYKYRNFEGICEAVKPLLVEYGCFLNISDHVELIGARYYIVATAIFGDAESGETIETTAMAREALTKKGMDDSQITGTASSYARKYCLNGLFLIDDTKDADTDEYHKQTHGKQEPEFASEKQISALRNFLKSKGISDEDALRAAKLKDFSKVTSKQYNTMARLAGDK